MFTLNLVIRGVLIILIGLGLWGALRADDLRVSGMSNSTATLSCADQHQTPDLLASASSQNSTEDEDEDEQDDDVVATSGIGYVQNVVTCEHESVLTHVESDAVGTMIIPPPETV